MHNDKPTQDVIRMIKSLVYFVFLFTLLSCSEEQKKNITTPPNVKRTSQVDITSKPIEKELIDILNDSLKNAIEIDRFLDSLTRQNNIHVISKLNEEWNEQEKCFYYFNASYKFKLKQDVKLKNGEEYTNTIFFDGKHKIDFSKHTILKDSDNDFETEEFGFNNSNSLTNCRIIQIGVRKFLYADVRFMCNGIGCGCIINMIYDLKNHTATFIENYRFPYSNFFISDFDSNGSTDLLLVTRNKKREMIRPGIEEVGFKVFWYENQNGKFTRKLDSSQKPYYYHFKGLTKNFNHENVKQYSLTDYHWKI